MWYQWLTIFGYAGEFLKATGIALGVTVLAFALAVVLGLAAALGRNSTFAPLRWIASIYVEVIRNTPVFLQIFVAYFALPSIGLNLNAFAAGVVALGVNVGAYLAEVFRAGISAVPPGQVEAAQVLDLNRAQTFAFVVMPQALRKVYPAIVNNLIQVLLGTSLLSAIALEEITGLSLDLNSRTLYFLPIFTIAIVIYLVLSNAFAGLAGVIGKHAFKPALEVPRQTMMSRILAGRRLKTKKAGALA